MGDFAFTIEFDGQTRPLCRALDRRWDVLASALNAADIDEISILVEERSGISREGVCGFMFSERGDDEVPQGKVCAFYNDENLYLDWGVFERAAAEVGFAVLDCLTKAGRPVSAQTRARLETIRARAAR